LQQKSAAVYIAVSKTHKIPNSLLQASTALLCVAAASTAIPQWEEKLKT
jgi:hypothetical protein